MTQEQLQKLQNHSDILYVYRIPFKTNEFTYLIVFNKFMDINDYTELISYEYNGNYIWMDHLSWWGAIEKCDILVYKCNALTPKNVIREYVSGYCYYDIIKLRKQFNQLQKWNISDRNTLYTAVSDMIYLEQILINHKIVKLDAPFRWHDSEFLLDKYNSLSESIHKLTDNAWNEYRKKQILENGTSKTKQADTMPS